MQQYSEPVLAIYRFMTEIVTTSSTEAWENSYKEAQNAEVRRISYENKMRQVDLVLTFSE